MQNMVEIELNNKEDFAIYINKVFKYVRKIEYVILEFDNKANKKILKYMKDNNIRPKKVKSWKGTTTSSKSNLLYRFNASPLFKELLLGFDNFFTISKKEISKNVYSCSIEETNWGQSDIAFYDNKNKVISFVIAHEGDVLVSEEYINQFESFRLDDRKTYFYGLG